MSYIYFICLQQRCKPGIYTVKVYRYRLEWCTQHTVLYSVYCVLTCVLCMSLLPYCILAGPRYYRYICNVSACGRVPYYLFRTLPVLA